MDNGKPVTQEQNKGPGQPRPSLFDKTAMLSVSFGILGNSKKISSKLVTADTDKEMLTLTKKLLESPELVAIQSHDAKIKSMIRGVSVPSPLRSGVYAVPEVSIASVEQTLNEAVAAREGLIAAFLDMYEIRTSESLVKLNQLGRQADYKTRKQAENSFRFEWLWFSFGIASSLRRVKAEMYEKETQKLKQKIAEAEEDAVYIVRAKWLALVERLADRLQPGEDGKQRIFRNSLVGNVEEFLSQVDNLLSVTNDVQLKRSVDKARKLLEGVTADRLRQDADIKEYIGQQFSNIQQEMEGMMVDRPERMVSFE